MNVKKEQIKDQCREEKWQCNEDDPLWRTYMKLYLENEKKLEKDDKFDHRRAGQLARLPDLLNDETILPSHCCFPLDTFNLSTRTRLPDRLNSTEKIRIWRNMKADPQHDEEKNLSKPIENEKKLWPCASRDFYEEQKNLNISQKRKLMGLLPCQNLFPDYIDINENSINCKELGHARLPVVCESIGKSLLVDRASGEHPGLVDGDYIYSELSSEDDENRVYTSVCLRGMKGMHLLELSETRAREKTWKFCFYQAIVVLLGKTQFRYKYITSSNIDYIYDNAWMLFIHIGSLNVKKKLSLDDVVVYNYKYFVDIEFIDELKDIPRVANVNWKYLEPGVKKIKSQKRPELMKITEELGWEKINHESLQRITEYSEPIEKFLSNIPENCYNFILRSCKFCLALWKDGNFWYLYNPYRCDSFGYWDDRGNACIMKFTSRNTLNRHIVILLLRAYSYEAPGIKITSQISKKDTPLILELFKITYKCGKIYNLKFLQRKPPESRLTKLWKDEEINVLPEEYSGPVEKRFWLKKYDITWTKRTNDSRKKMKWHEYYVEEVEKIYSLWGEIHPTENIFSLKNRGNQGCACYIVAAGMSRIIAPEYWTPKTLDTIVICGDRYYTVSRLQRQATTSKNEYVTAWDMYLLRYFKIGDILFEIDVMKAIHGKLYTEESLWKILEQFFLQYSFGILSCENCSIGVFKLSGAYFMLDVNSIGPPIFNIGDGVGYLIRVTSFKKFIVSLVITIGSGESSNFSLYPVEIFNMIDVGS